MGKYREVGERIVAAASPRFKDFRVDFEKISNSASKAAREGREGLTPDDALTMFSDLDWDLRTPLQRRYAAECALEQVAHYHAKRFKLYIGRNASWPDEPAADALQMFVDRGRSDLAVELIRTYVDMQHKRLKRDYGTRNPRTPRGERAEGVQRAIDAIGLLPPQFRNERQSFSRTSRPSRPLLKRMATMRPETGSRASAARYGWNAALSRRVVQPCSEPYWSPCLPPHVVPPARPRMRLALPRPSRPSFPRRLRPRRSFRPTPQR
jgi:hypothetical protein